MTHTCPHPTCNLDVPNAQLACRTHWFALPPPLRNAINKTWRDRGKDGSRAWSANVMEARRLWAGTPALTRTPGQERLL